MNLLRRRTMAGNGAIIPNGYKRLLGIRFGASTYYLITGFNLKGSDTVKISVKINSACNVFGSYTNTSADDNYSLYVSTTSGSKYLRYGDGTYKSYWQSSALGVQYDITITPTGSSGMPSGQDDSWTALDFESVADMCIGTTSPSATSKKLDGDIVGAISVQEGQQTRFNAVPVERQADGVIGYYDTASKTFYEPVGAAPTSLGYA